MTVMPWRVMTFIFGGTLGALGDTFGRKKIVVGAMAGYGTCALCFIVGAASEQTWLLFVGVIVLGITAPYNPTAIGYVADISA